MRVLGISGEFEKIDKTELLFQTRVIRTQEKKRKLADSKLFAFLNLKHKLKACLFCMQLKSQTLNM